MAAFHFFGSGVPARVLCLEAGADLWVHVPAAVLAHLQHAVARGKPLTQAPLADGRWHVFDFARMLRYDEAGPGAPTAAALAWYDEAGGAFFPSGKEHFQVQPSEAFTVDENEAVAIVRRWTMDAAVVNRAVSCVKGPVSMRIYRDKEREFGGERQARLVRRLAGGRADGRQDLVPWFQLESDRGASRARPRFAPLAA